MSNQATLAISLNRGWSWFSLNVDLADMSLNSVLSGINSTNGDQIKSQVIFSDFYDDCESRALTHCV